MVQLQICYWPSLEKIWSGEDTQARSIKVLAATLQAIALALRLFTHAAVIDVRLEEEPHCLRNEVFPQAF